MRKSACECGHFIHKAAMQFHPYLYGRAFTVHTDHAAIKLLLNFRCSEGQLAHWLQELQQYNFRLEHRQGLKHNTADALSRHPCLDSDCRHCARQEAKEQLQREELDQGKCFSCQSAGISKSARRLMLSPRDGMPRS